MKCDSQIKEDKGIGLLETVKSLLIYRVGQRNCVFENNYI